ncbi:MAG TPA: hypothetical protein VH307_26065 [Streptosporangiaceae bacterium]|jgi:hypothetical protein|nr:hypothetical protein [Streptosporangiaceae bacterium]
MPHAEASIKGDQDWGDTGGSGGTAGSGETRPGNTGLAQPGGGPAAPGQAGTRPGQSGGGDPSSRSWGGRDPRGLLWNP